MVKHLQSFESMRAKEINSIVNDIHMECEEKKEVDLMIIISSHQHCALFVECKLNKVLVC